MSAPVAERGTAPAPAAGPRLSLTGVTKRFRSGRAEVEAVGGVDLEVASGRTVAFVGPSGCGKSTVLRMIAGLDAPTAGTIEADGGDPALLRDRGDIAVAFQDPALLPWRSVASNLALALRLARRPADPERIARLIETVGLAGFADTRPPQLSGGMRQRAAIARCLVTAPRLLLLDEPFGAVDELTRRRLDLELPAIWQASGATCVLVTHSVSEAVLLADEVVVMSPRPARVIGRVPVPIAHPRTPDVLAEPAFHDAVAEVEHALRLDVAP